MAIDSALSGPVSHYMGNVLGIAGILHSAIEVNGASEDLTILIKTVKCACLNRCGDILKRPEDYAKQDNYKLRQEDREFLLQLSDRAKQCDWSNPQQMHDLADFVDSYCR